MNKIASSIERTAGAGSYSSCGISVPSAILNVEILEEFRYGDTTKWQSNVRSSGWMI
jgi:hypothetical protein